MVEIMLFVRDVATGKRDFQHVRQRDDKGGFAGIEIDFPDAGILWSQHILVRVWRPGVSVTGAHIVDALEIGSHPPPAAGTDQ